MTGIEALRARMREAAEKAMAATSDNWFHGEYSDIEYAPPAGDENGAHWFPLADELAPAVCDYLIAAQPSATIALDAEITRLREERDRVTRERDGAYLTSQQAAQSYSNLMRVKEDIDAQRQDAEAALAVVTRERDEARKQVNGLRLSQSLDKDSAYVIRELLNRHNVPAAAFVDDHVANAIAQRDAAEAALSAAQEEVGRVQRWLSYVERELVAAMERGQLHHSLHVLVTGTQEPTDG